MTTTAIELIVESTSTQRPAPDVPSDNRQSPAFWGFPAATVRREGQEATSGQAWFWTPEWQAGEREASADIESGRTTFFESDDDFLRSLDR